MRQLSLDYIATIKLHISLQQKFLFCSHGVLGAGSLKLYFVCPHLGTGQKGSPFWGLVFSQQRERVEVEPHYSFSTYTTCVTLGHT